MTRSTTWLGLLLAGSLAAACAGGSGAGSGGAGEGGRERVASGPAGQTQVGEACTWRSGRGDAAIGARATYEVLCGSWREPSARIFVVDDMNAAALRQAAQMGGWSQYLGQRAFCEAGQDGRILGDVSAVVYPCRRRNGGVPHLALAASVGGQTYLADGVQTALPAIEATIGQAAGRSVGTAARGASATDILATRFRGQFGSGDIERYQGLMRVGARYNAEENFAAAEESFRDALALHQRLFGRDNPEQTDAVIHLALQISNQGRFAEAEELFVRADRLAQAVADPLLKARHVHYRAGHAANQGRVADALRLADTAEASYLRAAPRLTTIAEQARTRRAAEGSVALAGRTRGFDPRESPMEFEQSLVVDPTTQMAAQGLAEVNRLRAVLANRDGDYGRGRMLAGRAAGLLDTLGIDPGGARWRAVRVAGLGAAGMGDVPAAVGELSQSAAGLATALPDTPPLAKNLLERGAALARAGDSGIALSSFRDGASILRSRRASAPIATLFPYMERLHAEGERGIGTPTALHAEMFEASQLATGGITAGFIAQAAVRLGAGDQRVRELQDASNRLTDLYAQRDNAAATGKSAAEVAEIDRSIQEWDRRRAEAEAQVQASLPNYFQLVGTQVTAREVQEALRENEAFLSIVLGPARGFGFLIRRDSVTAYPVPLSLDEADRAVERLRAAFTPGADGRLPNFDVAASHDLYRRLIGPVGARLQGIESLTIATTGALQSLPFALLVKEAPPAIADATDYRRVAWLVRDHAMAYVPAPQSFVTLRRARPSAAPRRYVGFGDFIPIGRDAAQRAFPDPNCRSDIQALTELGRLPQTAAEIRIAGRRLNAAADAVSLGRDFTKGRVLRGGLEQYRIVHFAAHALLPSELRCMNEPVILTSLGAGRDAKDALLTAGEVVNLKLDADLVLLSACNTAGPDGRSAGEAFSGLARAFFFAGTRGLLASHWAVADESTALMVLETVLLVDAGGATPDVLREAQVGMLDSAGTGPNPAGWAHPFYWAPFVFVGATGGGAAPAAAPAAAAARAAAGG
ncbi:MAG: CHAT domain-containing protein [Alphaproteobacteria bacterium]|nr:CHAT domain-containing protein [Alphaproteobacteria bacterium]